MSDKELLPCPFCGGEAEPQRGFSVWSIHCLSCRKDFGYFNTKDRAIKAWNTRKYLENSDSLNSSEKPNSSIVKTFQVSRCVFCENITRQPEKPSPCDSCANYSRFILDKNCKPKIQITKSDIEKMVKPLQWEDLGKRTIYEDGFTEVYRSAESNLFFEMLKFRIFKCHNEFKELRLLDCFKGQSISIKSGNYSLDEIKQHAQNWIVDLVCSALGVEE